MERILKEFLGYCSKILLLGERCEDRKKKNLVQRNQQDHRIRALSGHSFFAISRTWS
jgi:hypothetical protein